MPMNIEIKAGNRKGRISSLKYNATPMLTSMAMPRISRFLLITLKTILKLIIEFIRPG
jgi:hypothetical protein